MSRTMMAFFLSFLVSVSPALAQKSDGADPSGANVLWEWGASGGRLLPNQIPGLTEILGLGGVRGGYRIGDMGFVESGVAVGSGFGASWTNAHLAARMEVPVETIVGIVFLGIDGVHYEGEGRSAKTFGGGHVGGGVQAQLGGSVWFRSNMKFTINPGTSMYIDFGLMFRMPGS